MTEVQLVMEYKHEVSTTSLLIAQKFGKRHDDVLKAIRTLECSESFSLRNFAESTYQSRGKHYPMYVITRDGFSFLAMGFSGKEAARFKEEFIEAFSKMEAYIKSQTGYKPLLATYSKRILSNPTKMVPDDYWSVFDECHSIMLLIEVEVGSQSEYDLVDSSIGRLWSSYRENQIWAQPHKYYPHEFNDQRGVRDSKCYNGSELQHFRKWLKRMYKPKHLYNYLLNKYTRDKNVYMLDKVKSAMPKLLA